MTETRVAYELREPYRDTYLGGVLRAGDHDLNVGELLEEGNGVIVLDSATDGIGVQVLDDYPALKRTKVPEDHEGPDATLEELTVPALKDEAQRRGITGTSSATKDNLVIALAVDNQRLADGAAQPDPYSVEALVSLADQEA